MELRLDIETIPDRHYIPNETYDAKRPLFLQYSSTIDYKRYKDKGVDN